MCDFFEYQVTYKASFQTYLGYAHMLKPNIKEGNKPRGDPRGNNHVKKLKWGEGGDNKKGKPEKLTLYKKDSSQQYQSQCLKRIVRDDWCKQNIEPLHWEIFIPTTR